MIPLATLGHTLVLGALLMATVGSVMGFVAGARKSLDGLRWARALGLGFAACMIIANVVMIVALLQHDFTVSYVAEVGTIQTPLHITIVSLWASLTGSILLWGGVLGVYVLGLLLALGEQHRAYQAWTLGVLLAICVMFSLLVAGVANPFAATEPFELSRLVAIYGADANGLPADGPGPNPLLQNHWLMIVHPPTLYLGYVGMALPFSMASAALLAGRLEAGWMAPLRRAFLVPWGFLSFGIILGGWWSYAVLGWGGYWAWDPVENASFMPWLTGTAFLHSAMMMQRRTSLKTWTLVLAMATFILTLFGTFLTRSGVFNSVHAFGSGLVGPVLLAFIVICGVFAVVLLSLREHTLHEDARSLPAAARVPKADRSLSPATRGALGVALWAALVLPPAVAITATIWRGLEDYTYGGMPLWPLAFAWLPLLLLFMSRRILSRDAMIVAQNATFSVFTFVVFLGTIFPMLSEALRDKKVSVGEPFFDFFAFPLGVMLVWLMGLGPMLPWGRQSIVGAWIRFLAPISVASASVLIAVATGIDKSFTLIAIFVCIAALVANLGEFAWPWVQRLARGKQPVDATWDLLRKGRRRWGGHIAHYGVIMCVLSMALAKGYSVERDLRFEKGESVAFEDYQLTYTGTELIQEPHRTRQVASFEVRQNGALIGTFGPALNKYKTRMDGLGSPSVRSTPSHDLYMSLMSVQSGGAAASLHLKRMPLVVWIWISGLVVLFGTGLAAWPEARRKTAAASARTSEQEAA
jgi:cytochrome c biogenesis factor